MNNKQYQKLKEDIRKSCDKHLSDNDTSFFIDLENIFNYYDKVK